MRREQILAAVDEGAQTAVERGAAALADAADRLAPLVDQAKRSSADAANDAYRRIRPALRDAQIRGARLASQTFDKVQPVLDDALEAVSPAVDKTVSTVRPVIDESLRRIPPLVDDARTVVQDDLLPRLSALLKEAASQPLAQEAAAQLAVATAVVTKEIAKAQKKAAKRARKANRTWPRTVGKILFVGAVVGGIVVAVKKLTTPPDAGWQSYTPADAFVADPVADESVAEDEFSEAVEEVADTIEAESTEAVQELLSDDAAEGGDAAPFGDSPYGEGSYVGSEPPEGFEIKGNTRSMKYHLPGGASYERTTAEVWFDTVEHAEAAGFSRPQR